MLDGICKRLRPAQEIVEERIDQFRAINDVRARLGVSRKVTARVDGSDHSVDLIIAWAEDLQIGEFALGDTRSVFVKR